MSESAEKIEKSYSVCKIMKKITCILLDIEGTVTSIDFVRKDLFNYGVENIENYIAENWNKPEVQKVVKQLINQDATEVSCQDAINVGSSQDVNTSKIQERVIAELKMEMKNSQKSPAVKELEGLVWLKGFIKGDLIAHLYPDVLDALKYWKSQNIKVYIYSNGSIESQRVLFQRSLFGDLTQYIDGYFDTNIGSKLDPDSYSKICQKIGKSSNEILFFSDHPREIFAANQKDMKTVLVIRDYDDFLFSEEMEYLTVLQPIISSFLQVIKDFEEECIEESKQEYLL